MCKCNGTSYLFRSVSPHICFSMLYSYDNRKPYLHCKNVLVFNYCDMACQYNTMVSFRRSCNFFFGPGSTFTNILLFLDASYEGRALFLMYFWNENCGSPTFQHASIHRNTNVHCGLQTIIISTDQGYTHHLHP